MSRENEERMADPNMVASHAEDFAKEAAGQAGDAMEEVRGRLSSAMESAKAAYERLEDQTRQAARATDRCVRDHPWETAGVALGLGVLIGVLVARR